jgi:DMSO/TMAO reductase YedYZ molybdopterin-dependent catalytic subunit
MHRALLFSVVLLLGLGATRPAARADAAYLTIVNGAGAPSALTSQDLAKLPAIQVSITFGTAQGPFHAAFAGPLLWTVLARTGAVDPAKPRQQAGQTILVIGRDGYAAALAIGEISPAFEGKQVILAEGMNGRPLRASHLRLIVPGDRKGARSVKDVVRIMVSTSAATPH